MTDKKGIDWTQKNVYEALGIEESKIKKTILIDLNEAKKYISRNGALYGIMGDQPEAFAEDFKNYFLKNE